MLSLWPQSWPFEILWSGHVDIEFSIWLLKLLPKSKRRKKLDSLISRVRMGTCWGIWYKGDGFLKGKEKLKAW